MTDQREKALGEANATGLSLLEELLGARAEGGAGFGLLGVQAGKAVTPAFLADAKALVFIDTWRVGLGASAARGGGFAIAKTASGEWSAPCFVTLTSLNVGAVLGVEHVRTLLGALTSRGMDRLIEGRSQVFGSDVAFQLWPLSEGGMRDTRVNVASTDWVVASVGKGLFFNLSLGGRTLNVDEAKNREVYGDVGAAASEILKGKVPRPEELFSMRPLYRRIDEVAQQAKIVT